MVVGAPHFAGTSYILPEGTHIVGVSPMSIWVVTISQFVQRRSADLSAGISMCSLTTGLTFAGLLLSATCR